MTAPRTRRQPAAESLPKRAAGKGLAALLPQAEDRTGDAPAPGDEPPRVAAEPEPLRPRDYNEVLDRRYPLTVSVTPGMPLACTDDDRAVPGKPAFTGEIQGAEEDIFTAIFNNWVAATEEDHRHADREHAIAHSGRPVPGEECTYASWTGESPQRHHDPRELSTAWLRAAPVLSAGELPEYGVIADG